MECVHIQVLLVCRLLGGLSSFRVSITGGFTVHAVELLNKNEHFGT